MAESTTMTTLREISPGQNLPETMRRIYFGSFPPEERRDWESLSGLHLSDQRFHVDMIMSGAKESGFITSWNFDGFTYVEHFAVDSASRGQGIGLEAIGLFVRKASSPVLLEVEPYGSDDMASRRIGFYRRAGFVLHDGFRYVQPPYSPDLPSVELQLMSTPGLGLSLEKVTEILHKEVYGQDL